MPLNSLASRNEGGPEREIVPGPIFILPGTGRWQRER